MQRNIDLILRIMKKILTTNGNAWQVYINKPLAQLIGIKTNEYTVSMIIKDKVLYIEKADDFAKNNLCIKKLIKRNTGYGLNLPLPILEVLEINPELDTVDIDVNANQIIIKKTL